MKLLQQVLIGHIPEGLVKDDEQIEALYQQLKEDSLDPYAYYFVMQLLPPNKDKDMEIIKMMKKRVKYPEHLLALVSINLLPGRSKYRKDIIEELTSDSEIPHHAWSGALKYKFPQDIEWAIVNKSVETTQGDAEKIANTYRSCLSDKKRLNYFINALDKLTLSTAQWQAIIDAIESTENPEYIASFAKGKMTGGG